MMQRNRTYAVLASIAGIALVSGALIGYTLLSGCEEARVDRPLVGSHGVRTIQSDLLIAFEHRGGAVCVPDGWIALGALREEAGVAYFESGKTGVLIRKGAFGFRTIEPKDSGYRVEIAYPLSVPRATVERVFRDVDHAFSSIGAWFEDRATERVAHTVLVTVGVAGERIYPDPGAQLSFYIGEPGSERAQGLLLHAVVHLYNRYAQTPEYLNTQEPFSPEEYAELEATWAETAFSSVRDAAFTRLNYLYRVHTAVVTQNAELVTESPFNDREAFMTLRPTVHVPRGGSYLEYQYGHYILAPLVAAATDALLTERGTGVRLRDLMREARRDNVSLVSLLERSLPERDVRTIERWAAADAAIPLDLVRRAIALYD
ncbi:hypothetical protein KGO06_00770 [Patescibacteria group bacterium]|nr:hypothetical protein [Patescibacteria group bacterium]